MSAPDAAPKHSLCTRCGRSRPIADRCAEAGHPGATFNPWLNRTWCLCGEVVTEGDTALLPPAGCCIPRGLR